MPHLPFRDIVTIVCGRGYECSLSVPVQDRVIIGSRIGSDGVELDGGVEFGTTLTLF